jgi:intracellular septation protein A
VPGAAATPLPDGSMHLSPITVKGILFGSGPRFARDAFGPLAAFYVLWKLWGLVPGIVAATAVALLAYRIEKRNERPGIVVRISLVLVAIQAAVGLITGSAEAYVALPVLVNAGYGFAFLGSTFLGRPLAGVFAEEMIALPDQVKRSRTHRMVFGRITLAWGTYMVARAAVRLVIIAALGVDVFVAVSFATGFPITMTLMSWSIWYGIRGFRRSGEWGPAIAALEAAALEAEFDADGETRDEAAPASSARRTAANRRARP